MPAFGMANALSVSLAHKACQNHRSASEQPYSKRDTVRPGNAGQRECAPEAGGAEDDVVHLLRQLHRRRAGGQDARAVRQPLRGFRLRH